MTKKWFLSQFFRDAGGNLVPVCSAYGGQWFCPRFPATDGGWALVLMLSAAQQTDAASYDPRVVVIPGVGPVPQSVVDTYSTHGATSTMTISDVLLKLSEVEPLFLSQG